MLDVPTIKVAARTQERTCNMADGLPTEYVTVELDQRGLSFLVATHVNAQYELDLAQGNLTYSVVYYVGDEGTITCQVHIWREEIVNTQHLTRVATA